ncbi:predicted protein [Histoplasma capsulatum var. duboisii H88]|uniref:Predicted protein n=1 Tax=Ajellomyces capsulatus (strain H88) TaxID=544711 RepID=F0UMW0_AJEC8|nr:predicted protein [Histoplasma capsulatum var. duboisii H88]
MKELQQLSRELEWISVHESSQRVFQLQLTGRRAQTYTDSLYERDSERVQCYSCVAARRYCHIWSGGLARSHASGRAEEPFRESVVLWGSFENAQSLDSAETTSNNPFKGPSCDARRIYADSKNIQLTE